MSITRFTHLTAVALLAALVPVAVSADPQPALKPALGPSMRVEQGFFLGMDTYEPAVAVLYLDSSIKHGKHSKTELARIADETRSAELSSYNEAAKQLDIFGAPESIREPYEKAADALAQPLETSADAKQQVPNDPDSQRVWSVLDEADALAPKETGALEAWIKLSRGVGALWAYHVGNLYAVLGADIPGSPNDLPLLTNAGVLARSAPATTPSSLIDALSDTGERAQRRKLDRDSLKTLNDAIANVFLPASTAPKLH